MKMILKNHFHFRQFGAHKAPNPRIRGGLANFNFGGIWRNLAESGASWRRLAPVGAVWRQLAPFGAKNLVIFNLAPDSAIWRQMAEF